MGIHVTHASAIYITIGRNMKKPLAIAAVCHFSRSRIIFIIDFNFNDFISKIILEFFFRGKWRSKRVSIIPSIALL